MTEPNLEQDETPQPPKSKRKPDRPGSGVFWYILVGGIGLIVVAAALRGGDGTELPMSEFRRGVDNGKFTEDTVSNLVLGRDVITFRYNPQGFQSAEKDAEKSSATQPDEDQTVHYRIKTLGESPESRQRLADLLYEAGLTYSHQEDRTGWQAMIYLLLLPLLFLGVFIFLLRKVGGPGAAMSFGRSRGKLAAQEDIGISYKENLKHLF